MAGPIRWTGRLIRWGLVAVGVLAVIFAGLLSVPVSQPPELASIHAGALAIDYAGMPDPLRFQARDGTSLAYRLYPAADGSTRDVAIVIHGSAGHSASMNQIAKRLAAENVVVVSPDMRGHGYSGTRGDIGYGGQLDDDFADLLAELHRQYPQSRFELLGFSSGGGFALRIASEELGADLVRLVLLSPYLGYDAASTRSVGDSAHWASPDIPRAIALAMLRRLGLRCCEALPVIAFAVPPRSEKRVTARYTFRLPTNFGAPRNLAAAFGRLKMPTTIIVGGADELMYPDKYGDIVQGIKPAINVKIVSGLHHMDMLHAASAIDVIAAAMRAQPNPR